MLSRRNFLKASSALAVALMGGLYFTRKTKINAKHILCSASHDKLAVSLSLPKGISQLELKVNNLTFNARRVDLEGKHWQILADKLAYITKSSASTNLSTACPFDPTTLLGSTTTRLLPTGLVRMSPEFNLSAIIEEILV